MHGEEDQRLALLFPLPMEGLGDLDDRGGDAEGRPTPTGGRWHWQDLTSVTTQRADVSFQRCSQQNITPPHP